MTIVLLDPTGDVAKASAKAENVLEVLTGKRVGYVFNQHASARDFWKALEQEIDGAFHPSAVQRVAKVNTWAPAPVAEIDRLVRETDYALVGVGA